MTPENLTTVICPNLLRAPGNNFGMIMANMAPIAVLFKALIVHVRRYSNILQAHTNNSLRFTPSSAMTNRIMRTKRIFRSTKTQPVVNPMMEFLATSERRLPNLTHLLNLGSPRSLTLNIAPFVSFIL